MGPLLLTELHREGIEAGPADDHRWPDRGSDVDRSLRRRQDVLLLHQREGHRPAAYLGGAGGWRHAAASDWRHRHRDLANAACLRQAAGDSERGLEASAVDRRLEPRLNVDADDA